MLVLCISLFCGGMFGELEYSGIFVFSGLVCYVWWVVWFKFYLMVFFVWVDIVLIECDLVLCCSF